MKKREEREQRPRRRGRRPADAEERRARVAEALTDLEAADVPFTMADLAERAGISRATLYRDAGLRDLVGTRGDGPAARPVNAKHHADLAARAETLSQERRTLRRALREAEKRASDAEARIDALQAAVADAQRAERVREEAYARGFAAGARTAQPVSAGASAHPALATAAARLPRPALVQARRALARALHPDLFAQDPVASLLATELLKQINALIAPADRSHGL